MRRLLPLFIPVALVLAACGGDDGPSPSSADAAAEAETDHAEHGPAAEVAGGARTIQVAASSFAFDPETIEAEAGEDLAIELSATDVEHDFVLEETDVHVVAAEKGETATGGLAAPDEAGEYTYFCSVDGHREAGMEGTLVVR